jgi:dolichol-phosphate mannosyltransferase
MKTVIVIPTYNESKNINILIPQIFKILPDINVLVVDDNSPDGTADIVLKHMSVHSGLSILRRDRKEGLGKAYLHAFQEVLKDKSVENIVMMDADFSHDPLYLPLLLENVKDNIVVIGSRYIKKGKIIGWSPYRKFLSYWGNWYCRIITGMPVADCTGGYNAISISSLRKIDFSTINLSGYAFIMGLKHALFMSGVNFVEVPIIFNDRIHGVSKISNKIIKEGIIAPWLMNFNYKNQSKVSNKIEKKDTECPLCEDTSTLFFCKKNGYDIFKCKTCQLLFIYPLPKSIEVYDESYFSGAEKGFGYINYDADKEPMIPIFNKYLDILNKIGMKKGKLLDIGAATGFFMNLAQKRGFDVVGVELSDFAAKKGREKGLNVITGDLISQKFPSEQYDVVTIFDVIEHVPNPKELIIEVKRILKKGGVIVMNTPDAGSFWARVWGKNWQLIVPPEHVNYFNIKNLSNYLSKNGFEVKLVSKIGKSFTIQYIINMLYKWSGLSIFKLKSNPTSIFMKFSIPINLRDNFFIVSKKL